ncbi:MAG: L,D-transpeptidase [bacterium]
MNKSTATGLFYISILILLVLPLISATPQANAPEDFNPERVDEIYVSLDNFELLTLHNDQLISRYPIATGADTGPTPRGEFKIVNKLKNPWYTPPDEEAEPPGPKNPLGTRWLGINKPSYGIHGTRKPEKIGEAVSEGCIRLYNRHVEILYERVQPGTRVKITENIPEKLREQDPLISPPEPARADAGQ